MMRRVRTDDRGTSLLIVLMIITFVSVVMGVVLSQEGTSVRTSAVLSDVTSDHYGADAASQAAVTQLKNGQFQCATTAPSTISFGSGESPFYTPVGGTGGPLNATATCTPDTTTGVTTTSSTTGSGTKVGPANTPSAAITAVGDTIFDGVDVTGTLCVQGSVLSYTSVSALLGNVKAGSNSSGSPTACPDKADPAIKVQAFGNPIPLIPGCLGLLFQVTGCTPLGTSTPPIPAMPDPGLAITPANTDQPAVCQSSGTGSGAKFYAAFLPGLYDTVTSTKASSLSTPCQNSSGKWVAASIVWFTPGVYYFDFVGATNWTLPASLVGGIPANSAGQQIAGLNPATRATLTASTLSNLTQMPIGEGKCIPPTKQTQPGTGGVEFVFGGASTMTVAPPPTFIGIPTGPGGDMNICASYSATSPPVAIYGVYQKPLVEGTRTVSPQSGCVASLLGILGCSGSPSLINSASPVGDQTFHIDGYVWAPAAAISTAYANATGQAFNWGVLVRTFQITNLGLFATPLTMAKLPAPQPGQVTTSTSTYSIRYLNVWTCAASSSSCPQTGPPDVRIKLQQTGTTWKVLSWSAQH